MSTTVETPEGAPATRVVHPACDRCSQADDHPRHVIFAVVRNPVNDEPVDLSQHRHIDCCAEAGCEICKTDIEFAGAARGPELIQVMQNKSEDHRRALFERHGLESPGYEHGSKEQP